ncbi:DUF4167 domain-containing protein [Erythrobacter tepidarius]|uniref:DUF4167 domain-containing protein n=1 Tax=Erythrobacter tepidarius TaxID=60454 RepID=UPI000A3B321A|nr:DUF4167 domain-containing protein [Erythrobacter tepidarius]
MNNNRNSRRRGRGNRSQGGNGNQLNRIDSRARGNAPQLLEKYKKLAQDAQHNGDRVQMEYYLQFADHYFRVIADNKARQEEQRGGRRNDEREQSEDFDDDFDIDRSRRSAAPTRAHDQQGENGDATALAEGEPGQEGESFLVEERDDRDGPRDDGRARGRRRQQPRKSAQAAPDESRGERQERPERSEAPVELAERPARSEAKPARARRARKNADAGAPAGIDSSILPPSIRSDDAGGDSGTLETVD